MWSTQCGLERSVKGSFKGISRPLRSCLFSYYHEMNARAELEMGDGGCLSTLALLNAILCILSRSAPLKALVLYLPEMRVWPTIGPRINHGRALPQAKASRQPCFHILSTRASWAHSSFLDANFQLECQWLSLLILTSFIKIFIPLLIRL